MSSETVVERSLRLQVEMLESALANDRAALRVMNDNACLSMRQIRKATEQRDALMEERNLLLEENEAMMKVLRAVAYAPNTATPWAAWSAAHGIVEGADDIEEEVMLQEVSGKVNSW